MGKGAASNPYEGQIVSEPRVEPTEYVSTWAVAGVVLVNLVLMAGVLWATAIAHGKLDLAPLFDGRRGLVLEAMLVLGLPIASGAWMIGRLRRPAGND